MRQPVLVVALLFSVRLTAPGAQQVPPPPMADKVRLLQANQAGVPMVWEIPTERAIALPHWDLDAAPSPLSAEDATRIARSWLSRRSPQVEQFRIQQVTFSRAGAGSPSAAGFWYYTFFFIARGQPGAPLLFYAVVLPDGSPLEPVRVIAK